MAATAIQSQDGSWVCLAPISNLVLSKAIDREITIGDVTLIDPERVVWVRKRLGFPVPLSELKREHPLMVEKIFSQCRVVATMRLKGKPKDQEKVFLDRVREALDVISLSQLGWGRRKTNAKPSIYKEVASGQLTSLFLESREGKWLWQNKRTGKYQELVLDSRWRDFQKKSFFFDLLKMVGQKSKVSKSWKKDLRNAMLLAGQSQSSSDLSTCFLWNMIALETLLTRQGDKYTDKLPERVESFIGWTVDWSIKNYQYKIIDVYKKRCKFVHSGCREEIDISDVLFTDMLLLNIFINISKHANVFSSKEDVLAFSEKVQAERVLGVKPRVRPKTISFWNPRYGTKDYENL